MAVPKAQVVATEDDLTPVSGVALWGPLLDRLNLIDVADELVLREAGPGGYSGGECYRSLVEALLAGGDFLSDVDPLRDEATARLRGPHVLPSHDTLWRFCGQADLGRVAKAAAVNRVMLARAWEAGAAPPPGILTIDPDATKVATYGRTKQGSTFSYNYTGTCLHPSLACSRRPVRCAPSGAAPGTPTPAGRWGRSWTSASPRSLNIAVTTTGRG